MAAFSGASAEGAGAGAGRPLRASGPGRPAGSLWGGGGRGRVQRGPGGSCPRRPLVPGAAGAQGQPREARSARWVLRWVPSLRALARLGSSLLFLCSKSTLGGPARGPAATKTMWRRCLGCSGVPGLLCVERGSRAREPRRIGVWPGRRAAGLGQGLVRKMTILPPSSFFRPFQK